jgi:hypothetical protein
MFELDNILRNSVVTVQLTAFQEVFSSLHLVSYYYHYMCRDRTSGIEKACVLGGRVCNPSVQDLCHFHCVQTDSGAHPASYKSLTRNPWPELSILSATS